jgi:penicillin-binding protein 1A
MTSAYGVFANNGIKNQYTGILKIEDINGKVLEEFSQKIKEVLPKNTALTISDILSDNVARTPTFGANSILNIQGKDIAVKTGTTNSNKDAWTIGYTPSISVGVWAGNNDNTPMKKGGSAVAGPIWNKFINEALKILPDEKFEEPNIEIDPQKLKPVLRGFWQGNEHFLIDKISGKLANEFTPKETMQEKVITNVHSILYWVNRNDILGLPPTNPQDDSQFNHWEIPIQNWWAQNGNKYKITTWDQKPTTVDDVHTETNKPVVTIVEPNTMLTYAPNQRLQLKITSSSILPLQKMDIFINNIFMGTIKTPFNFSFIPEELDNLKSENEIRVISYDAALNSGETYSTFKVN